MADVDDTGSVSLLGGITSTRAIRRYTNEPVPEHALAEILFAASRAPSGSNRQPFRFVVLRDGPVATEAKALLGRAFRAGWKAKREHDRYEEGSGRSAGTPKARMAATMQRYVDQFEQIPVVVLACLQRYREPNPYEGASIYPACQNLLLAARALGYGGVMTMWHQAVEAELRELLAIPERAAISATITLGVPEGSHGPVRRLPLGELVFEERWGSTPSWAVDPDGVRHAATPSPPAG